MLSVLIVDDEKPARQILVSYLKELPGIRILGEAENGRAALELAQRLGPDLVLLDVEMPEMNGIETAAQLPAGTAIIFVTAYDRYAIKAFELHAFDYILKPVMKDRLEAAIRHVEALRQPASPQDAAHDAAHEVPAASAGESARAGTALTPDLAALLDFFRARQTYLTRLTIRNQFEYLVLSTFDISCIRVEEGLVFVYSRGLKYLHDTPLKKLEQHLDPASFIRIHRTTIVNRNHIKRVISPAKGRYAVETTDHLILPISRDYLGPFKTAMGWDL